MEHVGTGPDRPDDAAENRKQIHQSTETRTRAETRRGHSEQHYPEDALSVCAFVCVCVLVLTILVGTKIIFHKLWF